MAAPRKTPCLKCGYDLAGVEVGDNGVLCPECGSRHFLILSYQQPARSIAPPMAIKCPSCSYDLSHTDAVADITTCPECGRSYTRQQIHGTLPIPGYARSLLLMTLPLTLPLLNYFIHDKSQPPTPFDAALIAVAAIWGLAAPAWLSFRRARIHARVPRVALDEAIGGYAIVFIAAGSTVIFSLFMHL